MSLIMKSAYLDLCTHCGEHGQIVFSDGSMSESFRSKEDALANLRHAYQMSYITRDERLAIEEQIRNAPCMNETCQAEAAPEVGNWLAEMVAEIVSASARRSAHWAAARNN